MTIAGADKLYHALASAAITCSTFTLLFLALECYYQRIRGSGEENNDVEMAAAAPSSHDDGLGENYCLRFPDRPRRHYLILSAISGVLTMAVGVTKEIFDAYDILWTGGDASWGDVLADFVGVAVGEFVIFVALHSRPFVICLGANVRAVRARASDYDSRHRSTDEQ